MQRLMVFLGHPVYGWLESLSQFFSLTGSAAPRLVRIPVDRARSSLGLSHF